MNNGPRTLPNPLVTFPRFNPSFADLGDYDEMQEISHIDSGCAYHTPTLNFEGRLGDSFNVIHVNIRSLAKNVDKLNSLISQVNTSFDVICLSETWLVDSLANNYCLPDYCIINSCPDNYRGKGAALLIKNNTVYHELPELSIKHPHFQSVFVEIAPISGANIVLGTMYRSPSFDPSDFVEYLEKITNLVTQTNKKIILTGDFNLDILKINNSEIVDRYLACLIGAGFLPTITIPTRITAMSQTLIDNIFVNNFQCIRQSGAIINDCSDHLPIFLIIEMPACGQTNDNNKAEHLKTSVFDYRKIETLARRVKTKLDGFTETDDPEAGASYLTETIHSELTNLSTKRKKLKYEPVQPWISPGILRSINVKNKLHKKYVQRPTVEKENIFKQYRNRLNTTIKLAKKMYYREKLEENKNNPKRLWATHMVPTA